jgi:uncharacterized protein (DUF4415 family)
MKKQKHAKKRGKIAPLRASAEGRTLPRDMVQEWTTYFRPLKKPVTLRLDADVLAWFKKGGRGYQTRINLALRKAVAGERKG